MNENVYIEKLIVLTNLLGSRARRLRAFLAVDVPPVIVENERKLVNNAITQLRTLLDQKESEAQNERC